MITRYHINSGRSSPDINRTFKLTFMAAKKKAAKKKAAKKKKK